MLYEPVCRIALATTEGTVDTRPSVVFFTFAPPVLRVNHPLRKALEPIARAARRSRAAADGLAAYAAGLPDSGDIRVSYGFDVPPPTAQVHGGIVKLQSLAERFPHEPRR